MKIGQCLVLKMAVHGLLTCQMFSKCKGLYILSYQSPYGLSDIHLTDKINLYHMFFSLLMTNNLRLKYDTVYFNPSSIDLHGTNL